MDAHEIVNTLRQIVGVAVPIAGVAYFLWRIESNILAEQRLELHRQRELIAGQQGELIAGAIERRTLREELDTVKAETASCLRERDADRAALAELRSRLDSLETTRREATP